MAPAQSRVRGHLYPSEAQGDPEPGAPPSSERAGDLLRSLSAHPGLEKHLRECFLNNV